MIEQGIYFALGCIVTALLALLFAPVFWRRALRLTRQRLQLQVPLSMQEILAERDQLRASFAVERLRIEQRMERIQATKTNDLIEIGRRTMEAGALAEEITALRRQEEGRQNELESLLREAVENGAEKNALSTALEESKDKIEHWRNEAEAARVARRTQQDELALHRTTIASLKSRVTGLNLPLADPEEAHVAGEKSVEENLRGRLEIAVGQSARHEAANIVLQRELEGAKAHIRRLEDELAARELRARDASSSEAASDDSEVRASIHALGVAVARLTREAHEADARAAHPAVEDKTRPVSVA